MPRDPIAKRATERGSKDTLTCASPVACREAAGDEGPRTGGVTGGAIGAAMGGALPGIATEVATEDEARLSRIEIELRRSTRNAS